MSEEKNDSVPVRVAAVAMIIFGLIVGAGLARAQCKQCAIDAGKAEWTIDQKTGKTDWR